MKKICLECWQIISIIACLHVCLSTTAWHHKNKIWTHIYLWYLRFLHMIYNKLPGSKWMLDTMDVTDRHMFCKKSPGSKGMLDTVIYQYVEAQSFKFINMCTPVTLPSIVLLCFWTILINSKYVKQLIFC